jgi:SacI restriction endonuclease
MGIKLEEEKLRLTLDDALQLARSNEELPALWIARVERLGALGIKTYIAAFGGALLAKATDPRVDSLAQDEAAGTKGYSLRRAAEFLALQNGDRYDLGAKGRWPLNNRPFLGGPTRIDEFTKISGKARPAYEAFLDSLRDLNRAQGTEALAAFAAFLRVRMGVHAAEREAARAARGLESDVALDDLVGIIDRYVRSAPEGGRRAQALAAAVLDCAFDDVVLQAINSPHPGDVRVILDGAIVLAVEAKQLPVGEEVALELSREAAELGADLAMLLVVADKHAPLDRDRLQRDSLRDDGTLLLVCESVLELIASVAVLSATSAAQVEADLPGAFAARLQEIEASRKGQEEWRQLIQDRA